MAVLAAALLAGCPADEHFPMRQCSIVGGHEEAGFAAVGQITTATAACTATLVLPRVLVTAQHCIPPGTAPEEIQFWTGENADRLEANGVEVFLAGEFEDAVDEQGNPISYIEPSQDFAVVALDREPSVQPIPLLPDAPGANLVGQSADIVGYGTTRLDAEDSYGIRRSGPATIALVGNPLIETERLAGDASGCYGDSGGPLIVDGAVVGVFVYFVDLVRTCEEGGQYIRVDLFQSLVDRAHEAVGGVVEDDPECSCEPSCAENGSCCAYCDPVDDDEGCPGDRCLPGDGFCDDQLDCCAADPDCSGGPDERTEEQACDSGVCVAGDGLCDDNLPCCAQDPDCPQTSC